jgi:hypothetical protein
MTDLPADSDLDEDALAAFARRLGDYAAGLNARDRTALKTLLMRAMDPIERMRWREAADLLSPAEEATLRSLLDEQQGVNG